MKKSFCFILMICLAGCLMLAGCGQQAEAAATTAAAAETTVAETTAKTTTAIAEETAGAASYSAERQVTDADREIFYEAMRNEGRNGGNIEFVSVATKGTTYRFTITRMGMMPGAGASTVYVTISKPAGGDARLISEENA